MRHFSSNPWKKGLRFSSYWKHSGQEVEMLRRWILFFTAVQLIGFAAPPAAEQQARALQAVLRQADEAYYNQHQPVMSDAAYDALRSQYQQLLADYPELAAESPVGAPAGKSARAEHDAPVLSLDKVYSDEGVTRFLEKTGTHLLYCVEPKIDGLTVVLRYRNGLLTQALTRGDGKTGTDITPAILASGAVLAALAHAPSQLDVRGEALLSLPAFAALNRRRAENGLEPLKNPRNVASGTLMLTDYAEIAARHLEFQCFELLATERPPATHSEALALIKQSGLPVVESVPVPANAVLSAVENLNQRRTQFPFMTDGLVIKVDDLAVRTRLGSTAHHPRGAIARKYEETPVQTRLLGVDWSRGETGRLTPVARFEPVEIQGATVQSATLHNLAHLRAMDLKIGDRIHVIRSGGSVPEITGVCLDRRTGSETAIPDPVE
jgi:DNA ligase (NAD+)